MELHFYPLDFDYHLRNGKPEVLLYGKLESGDRICVFYQYQPYFYLRLKDIDKETIIPILEKLDIPSRDIPAKIISWEESEKELLGKKEKFLKVFANQPKAVPIIAKELLLLGMDCYEKDIPFVHRFLRDKEITPMALVTAKGDYLREELNFKVPIFLAEEIKQFSKEPVQHLRILSLDIETYAKEKIIEPKKNPILMIALYGTDEQNKEFKKVITWKKFSHKLDYLEIVQDEVAMLKQFRELMINYQPDIITGYFSDGFDLPYLKMRADLHKINLDFGLDNSELDAGRETDFREGKSRIMGIPHLDILKFVRNIFGKNLKTDSYTLDAVSEELLGHKKQEVNIDGLADVWDHHHDHEEELEDFCKYNLHDAHLNLMLCQKLLFDMIEFSKIVGLPIFEVIRMRFSRLVESYILKRAIEFNVLAPNRPSHQEVDQRFEETFQGAFVFEPKPGLYSDIVVFDFRSLYPSIITSHNIGPESFRCICCKNKKENYVPEEDEFWFCSKKKKFIPTVLEQLILVRADLKKLIREAKKNKEDVKMLEARSWAIKTLANSFYGYLGFFGARWYCLECAKSTTAYARFYIKSAIKKAEEKGFRICYGDSLTPERKIFIKDGAGEISLVNLGDFVDRNLNNQKIRQYQTLSYNNHHLTFNPIVKAIRHDYDSVSKGKILRLITTHGTTRVTPQHSIYLYDQKNIKLTDAREIKKDEMLVSLNNVPTFEKYSGGHIFDLARLNFGHLEKEMYFYTDNFKFPQKRGICPYCKREVMLSNHVFIRHQDRKTPKSENLEPKYLWVGTKNAEVGKIPRFWVLTKELSWILGYYCAEGSVSDSKTERGNRKSLLSFGSQDRGQMERLKRYFDSLLGENLKIIVDFDRRINKEMYYYRVQRRPLVGLFEMGFGCGKGSQGKKVPNFIYTAEEDIRRAFLEGYLKGDGNSALDKRYKTHFARFDTNSKDLACGLAYLFKSLDWGKSYFGRKIQHVGWKYRLDKPKVSSLRVQGIRKLEWERDNCCAARIKEIIPEEYQGLVYDLEVSGSHNFVDAEGLILVHNTDSMFLLLGDKTLPEAMEFMKSVNKDLPGQMELEFENYYPKGLFVATKGTEKGAKKRYALISKEGKMKITGFEVIRRNSSPIAREVQEKVLRDILENRTGEAIKYVKEIIKDLQDGNVPLRMLTIKTQLTKEISEYSSISPHVAIARKLESLGEKIFPGRRIEYLIIRGKGLIRDKARLPNEVKEGEYDPEYYLKHQIMPALSGIFAVLGFKEEDLLEKSSQTGLGKFF